MGLIADLAAALAALPDHELHLLRAAIEREPVVVPALSGWLEAAAAWEINRRAGIRFDLPDPRASIHAGEVECGLVVLAILWARLRSVERAAHFLDVMAAAMCEDAWGSSPSVH